MLQYIINSSAIWLTGLIAFDIFPAQRGASWVQQVLPVAYTNGRDAYPALVMGL